MSVNCDAFHATAPDPQGIAAAIRDAHTRAGVKAEDIELVMVHGTGTQLNDAAEGTALQEVYGPHIGRPVMTGVKSMTGHTSGASGVLSLIVALRSMRKDGSRPSPVWTTSRTRRPSSGSSATRASGPMCSWRRSTRSASAGSTRWQ